VEGVEMTMKIKNARVYHLQIPIKEPVKTSFGVMGSRHTVLILLEDVNGHQGVGESWVNFPLWAPWERTHAFEKSYLPYLKDQEIEDVAAFIADMALAFRGPALQSATMGPYIQALCAVEMALWDLAAKIQDIPLNMLFFSDPKKAIQVYGSGINSPIPHEIINEHLDRGVKLFKLKMGFSNSDDLKSLEDLSDHLGTSAKIAVDVNRGWRLDEAMDWLETLKAFKVQWLEEPLRVEDEPHLRALFDQNLVKIAGGENFLIDPVWCDIEDLADSPLDIFQPDITKYCRIHNALQLLTAVNTRGSALYPHFLGSAPGQAASLHLASGCGEILMELDVNPNPLRTELFKEPIEIENGYVHIPDAPGISWELDFEMVKKYMVT